MADYYLLLDVRRSASAEEIRAAITAQRRIWVRRQSSPDPERRTEAEQRVRDIDQAERTLLDPERRRAYDTQGPAAPVVPARDETNRMPPPRPTTHNVDETGSAEFHIRRGDAYLDSGRWPLAIAEYEAARERDPENVDALEGIALAYLNSGRTNEGLKVLDQALAEQPENENVKNTLANALYNAALADIGQDQRITSRRELTAVKRRLRRLRKVGATDRAVPNMIQHLRDILADAGKAWWRPSHNKKWYAILLTGSVLLAISQMSTFSYVMGGLFFTAFVALYVVRHRIPSWRSPNRRNHRWR
jgi:tetratricopeptide (TPR) repeat protein